MIILVIILLAVLLVFFPTFRCAVFNLPFVIYNGVRDLYFYFARKLYNLYPTGELVAYTGLFGKGKTLSVVHRVAGAYKKFNGKKVWCMRRKKMVTQRIRILSNVSLLVPFEKLESLAQIVQAAEDSRKYDDEHGTLTVTLVLGDEFSVQMNSRNFKTNIDPLFLNTILTCRHFHISLYYTAQRFMHVDALLRQVTRHVFECDKLWRFQRLSKFDAWDLENATNTQLIQPLGRFCWFVHDADYNAYDTLATVGNLKKAVDSNDMLPENEILNLRQNSPANMDGVSNPSRQYSRQRQKGKR